MLRKLAAVNSSGIFFANIVELLPNTIFMKQKWHMMPLKEVLGVLETSRGGLKTESVQLRLSKYGYNEFSQKRNFHKLKVFFTQFVSPLIYILVFAGVATIFMGEITDSIVIFAAVILNVLIGFFQENKAYNSLEKLREFVKPYAYVLRDGVEKEIEARELALGDIIVLKAGEHVPADARLFDVDGLQINESVLTGEWLPAEKTEGMLKEDVVLADRDNMIYMGTNVEGGRGLAVVVATGDKTEMGKIADVLTNIKEEKTPLQKKIATLGKLTALVIFLICIVVFLVGIYRDKSFILMFEMAVVIAVSAIPEGLPIAITVILAVGMKDILAEKGLVRHLNSAETLGSVTTICTDKTGTLTEAKMELGVIATGTSGMQLLGKCMQNADGKHSEENLFALNIAALCSDAVIENPYDELNDWMIHGRATDKALVYAAVQAGFDVNKINKTFPIVFDISFSSANKYSANLRRLNNRKGTFYLMGAPEKVLKFSNLFKDAGNIVRLTGELRNKIQDKVEEMSKCGLRVIAVGFKTVITDNIEQEIKLRQKEDVLDEDFIFVGLIGLRDPVRKEVKATIKLIQHSGIRMIIVTGDHKLTAKAVAVEAGVNMKNKKIFEGAQVEKMSDEELKHALNEAVIFARVEPKHKLRIVKMLQQKHEVVAMTGDGVNDAPALKLADIGIALGSGTDVAKDSSGLVILDDSFSTIIAAIRKGRVIFDNIRKVIVYFFSDVLQEVILILGALALNLPLPILPAQILWINLVEDSLPAMALALEPEEEGIMEQKPRGLKSPLLNKEMKFLVFIIGTLTNAIVFGIYYFLLFEQKMPIDHIRSVIFVSIGIDSLFYVFACRSLKKSIWEINLFSNKYLLGAIGFSLCLLAGAVYIPVLQTLLHTEPLRLFDWGIIIGFGIINIIVIELAKKYFIIKKQID